jgi:predicted Zn-dependent peptidase
MSAMPTLAPPRDIVLPEVLEQRVGTTAVLAARLPTVPLVQVRARLATGGGAASSLLAACLLDGRVAGTTIRQRLASLGATSDVQSDPDGVVLTVAAPADRAAEVAGIVAGVGTAEPPSADVLTAERARLAAVTQTLLSDAGESARRTALAVAYGGTHPYADALPTAEALAAIDDSAVGDLLASSTLSSLTVVGDIDPGAAVSAVTGLPERSAVPAVPSPASGHGCRFVDRPGSVQTSLRSVVAAPVLGDPRRAAAEVLDLVLGNGHCSVFARVLREKHGYGYHPASELVSRRGAAQLELVVDVAIEVTGAALAVLEEELAALAAEPVATEWLEIARRGALAGLGRRMDGQAVLADLLQELAEAGLSPSYLSEHVSALHDVTAADVQALAAELLDLDRMAVVLVSDRTALAGQPPSRLLSSAS